MQTWQECLRGVTLGTLESCKSQALAPTGKPVKLSRTSVYPADQCIRSEVCKIDWLFDCGLANTNALGFLAAQSSKQKLGDRFWRNWIWCFYDFNWVRLSIVGKL